MRAKVRVPEQYVIKDVNFNFKDGVATTPYVNNGIHTVQQAADNIIGLLQ